MFTNVLIMWLVEKKNSWLIFLPSSNDGSHEISSLHMEAIEKFAGKSPRKPITDAKEKEIPRALLNIALWSDLIRQCPVYNDIVIFRPPCNSKTAKKQIVGWLVSISLSSCPQVSACISQGRVSRYLFPSERGVSPLWDHSTTLRSKVG